MYTSLLYKYFIVIFRGGKKNKKTPMKMHNHGREKKECVVWMRKQKKLKNNKKYRKVKGTVDTHTHTHTHTHTRHTHTCVLFGREKKKINNKKHRKIKVTVNL